ncbi:MAG: putative lipid II flippase FtsW [Deltaproteobacteria bacterium]|nr:MAG: putative lipid II flippase FtsW [Deltaproteobacteria bacterium]
MSAASRRSLAARASGVRRARPPQRASARPRVPEARPPRGSSPVLVDQQPIVEVPERGIDLVLLAATLVLVCIGTVEIFSSSAVYALNKHGDSTYFLQRQLVWLSLGLAAMAAGATMNYRWLRRHTYKLLLVALALLASVPFFGARINGAARWFAIGPLTFQPVEIAKLALISYLAYSLARKADRVKAFTIGFVPHLVVCAAMMGLLLLQPDLGSAIILGATTLTLLFVAGAKVSYIALSVLAAAPAVYYAIVGTPWRLKRFMAYFNPEAYADGVAYQVVQSLIAVGSGGATGVGLGRGRQHLGYMPEMHSDFILSGIGEELGFAGICAVLVLFAVVLWRGVRAALGARDVYGAYLAFGITVTFAFQALVNAGVVLGVLPAKGLTLPLVSYGGSSLVTSMFLIGLVLNVSRRAPPPPARRRVVINRVGARRRRARVAIARA